MLTSTLLKRMKRVRDALPAQPPKYVAEAVRLANVAWERLGPVLTLLPDHAVGQLHDVVRRRLVGLSENAALGMYSWAPAVKAALAYPAALADLLELTPADLRADVIGNLAGEYGPLHSWLDELADGHSRLPPDLGEEAMGRLLAVYLREPVERLDTFRDHCPRCGLARPRPIPPPISTWKLTPDCPPDRLVYDLPEWFKVCPHCGTGTK
jgi:hypothetical protein